MSEAARLARLEYVELLIRLVEGGQPEAAALEQAKEKARALMLSRREVTELLTMAKQAVRRRRKAMARAKQ